MRPLRLYLALALLSLSAAQPAAAQAVTCAAGANPALEAELFFGRNIGGKLGVTEARWARFVAEEVTPRFPDGLTVLDGTGQWRDTKSARIVREPSKVVVLVLRDAAKAQAQIDAVVAAYKARFRQQSVGVVTRPVCAAF